MSGKDYGCKTSVRRVPVVSVEERSGEGSFTSFPIKEGVVTPWFGLFYSKTGRKGSCREKKFCDNSV